MTEVDALRSEIAAIKAEFAAFRLEQMEAASCGAIENSFFPIGSAATAAQIEGEAVTNGCFALVVETEEPAQEGDDPVTTAHFANRYFNYSNITLECADLTLSAGGVFVALKVTTTASYPTPTASIETYATLAALQADQRAHGYVVIPLYNLDSDFSILVDFRVAPMALVGEVL